jgi:hypothetical protein
VTAARNARKAGEPVRSVQMKKINAKRMGKNRNKNVSCVTAGEYHPDNIELIRRA